MAVGPCRLLSVRRAARVEEAALGEEDVRLLADRAAPRLALGGGDLLERSAEVDGCGARALLRGPRDRPVERPVDLEHARPVAELLQPVAIPRRELVAGHRDELARRYVEQDRLRIASSASDSTRVPVSISPPSERRCAASASASCCEPPRGNGQPTACPSIRALSPNAVARLRERKQRVRAHPREEASRALATEREPRQRRRRRAGAHPEPRECKRMRRNPERPKDVGGRSRRSPRKRREDPRVAARVAASVAPAPRPTARARLPSRRRTDAPTPRATRSTRRRAR